MKKTFLLFSIFIPLISIAQVFNFEREWFDNYSFFTSDFIQNNGIESIAISMSEKKDGKYFKDENMILYYEYEASGKLAASYKFIPLRNRIDTAVFRFYYNNYEQLYKRTEKQGPFHFGYYFSYDQGILKKEIKINQNSKDTAYLRYFETTTHHLEERTTLLNSSGKPFATIHKKFDDSKHLLSKKLAYSRNSNYAESVFTYKGDFLIKKEERKGSTIEITYNGDKPELIKIYKEGKLQKKYAFTFMENGMPKEIIERHLIEKTIRVYKLNYRYRGN